MGLEARCEIRFAPVDGDERVGEGAVHLDDAELLARGEARHRIPRASITGVAARAGLLVVTHAAGTTTLALGDPASARWAAKLVAAPKSVIDKLDIAEGMHVSVVGVSDDALLAEVAARAGRVTKARIATASDVVLVGIMEPAHLERIATAAEKLGRGGCIWALHPRGVPAVADTVIFAKAKACGLTYTKVVRVSGELSGEKLVRSRESMRSAAK